MKIAHEIFVACDPPKSTAQAGSIILKRRDGTQFVGRASGGKADKAKKTLLALFADTPPPRPLEGPVRLDIEIQWPWRKSEPKRRIAHGIALHDKRPDLDNYAKFLLDILTTLHWWGDDGQVAVLHMDKTWGNHPGIRIRVSELEDADEGPNV